MNLGFPVIYPQRPAVRSDVEFSPNIPCPQLRVLQLIPVTLVQAVRSRDVVRGLQEPAWD